MAMRILSAVFSLALLAAAFQARAQEPLGMVVDVQGSVMALDAGKVARVEMLSYLKPNMELELAAGASLTATWYANSKELRFSGPAKLRVQRDRVQVVQGGGANERSLGEDKVAPGKNGIPPRLAQATVMMRSMKPAGVQDEPSALSGAEQDRLVKLKPAAGAGFSDWLLYALALEEAKQTAEARPIWKRLSAERPDEPRLKNYAER